MFINTKDMMILSVNLYEQHCTGEAGNGAEDAYKYLIALTYLANSDQQLHVICLGLQENGPMVI